jgi:hypothetical protein
VNGTSAFRAGNIVVDVGIPALGRNIDVAADKKRRLQRFAEHVFHLLVRTNHRERLAIAFRCLERSENTYHQHRHAAAYRDERQQATDREEPLPVAAKPGSFLRRFHASLCGMEIVPTT